MIKISCYNAIQLAGKSIIVWHFLEGLPNWPMVALPLGPNVLLNPREEACSVLVYWTSLHREISVIFNIQTSVIMNSPRSWSPKQSLECWCLGWLSATDNFRASRAFYRSQQEWTLSLSSTATMSSSLGCRYLKICQTLGGKEALVW